jgi:hypothetical protein
MPGPSVRLQTRLLLPAASATVLYFSTKAGLPGVQRALLRLTYSFVLCHAPTRGWSMQDNAARLLCRCAVRALPARP